MIDAVGALRPGEVATYGEIAEEVGRPGSGQAVANVLRAVPDLPWWRVVPTGGHLYRTHAAVQAPLLEAEGHRIEDQRLVTGADHPHREVGPLGAPERAPRPNLPPEAVST